MKNQTYRASVIDDFKDERFYLCNEDTQMQVKVGDKILDYDSNEFTIEGGTAPQGKFDIGSVKVKEKPFNLSLSKFPDLTWERI